MKASRRCFELRDTYTIRLKFEIKKGEHQIDIYSSDVACSIDVKIGAEKSLRERERKRKGKRRLNTTDGENICATKNTQTKHTSLYT